MNVESIIRSMRIPVMIGALHLTMATAHAATADSLCSLAEDTLRASLQLASVEAVNSVEPKEIPGAGIQHVITCSWTSPKRDRALTLTSTGSSLPLDMPVTCSEQKDADKSLVMCMAGAASPLLTVVLTQSGGKGDAKLLPVLRAHTEVMIKKWSQLSAKQP